MAEICENVQLIFQKKAKHSYKYVYIFSSYIFNIFKTSVVMYEKFLIDKYCHIFAQGIHMEQFETCQIFVSLKYNIIKNMLDVLI